MGEFDETLHLGIDDIRSLIREGRSDEIKRKLGEKFAGMALRLYEEGVISFICNQIEPQSVPSADDMHLMIDIVYYSKKSIPVPMFQFFTQDKIFFSKLSDDMKLRFLESQIPEALEKGEELWNGLAFLGRVLTYSNSEIRRRAIDFILKMLNNPGIGGKLERATADVATLAERVYCAFACRLEYNQSLEKLLTILEMLCYNSAHARDSVHKYFDSPQPRMSAILFCNVVREINSSVAAPYLLSITFNVIKYADDSLASDPIPAYNHIFSALLMNSHLFGQDDANCKELLRAMKTLKSFDSHKVDAKAVFSALPKKRRERIESLWDQIGADYVPYTEQTKADSLHLRRFRQLLQGPLDRISSEVSPRMKKLEETYLVTIYERTDEPRHSSTFYVPLDVSFSYIERRLNCDAEHKLEEMLVKRMEAADQDLLRVWKCCKFQNDWTKDELLDSMSRRLNLGGYNRFVFKALWESPAEGLNRGKNTYSINDCLRDAILDSNLEYPGFNGSPMFVAIQVDVSSGRHLRQPIQAVPTLWASYQWLLAAPEDQQREVQNQMAIVPPCDHYFVSELSHYPLLLSEEGRTELATKYLEFERERLQKSGQIVRVTIVDQDFPVLFESIVHGPHLLEVHDELEQECTAQFLKNVAKDLTSDGWGTGVWKTIEGRLIPERCAPSTCMKIFGKLCALSLLMNMSLSVSISPRFFLHVQGLPDATTAAEPGTELCLSSDFSRRFRSGFSRLLPLEVLNLFPAASLASFISGDAPE